MQSRKMTMKDIADALGVSAMTVSKALNNKPGISEHTRRRVQDMAREIGYVPNLSAKSLRTNHSGTLGVVLSDSSEMVTSKVLRAIEDAGAEQGYNVIVANTDHNPQRERKAIRTLVSKQIDGLVMVAPLLYAETDIASLRQYDKPFVFLMRKNDSAPLDSVINDNHLGGWQIIEHLISEGCSRFLFLLIDNSQSSAERREGCLKALEAHGIGEADCLFLYTKPNIDMARCALAEQLARDGNFDAVVCGCDVQAIGAMDALLQAGRQIPRDVCLTGYDGVELAQYLRVPLTTVNQPFYEIGWQGTEILMDRIKYRDMPVRKIVLKSELVCRESSLRRRNPGIRGVLHF